MPEDDRRARGRRHFCEVTQAPAAPEPTDAFLAFTIDAVFGDVWSRPGLTRKERRLLSISATASSGMVDETAVHMRGALASGDVTPAEMLEVVVHLAHYSGWPRAAAAYRQLLGICAELGIGLPGADA